MKARALILYLLFTLSGVAGLGYEIIWTRQFAVGLGHEFPAVVAVVAAFFGGFAVGAIALDGAVARSAHPARWYAGLEAVVGLWALATILLIPAANDALAAWVGWETTPLRQWFASFIVPMIGLLPATAAMGATLPAMDRLIEHVTSRGRVIGGLYAVNTFGAVVGTLAVTHAIVPAFGYRGAVIGLAMVNLACAGLVVVCAGQSRPVPCGAGAGAVAVGSGPVQRPPATHAATTGAATIDAAPGRRSLYVVLFVTGLLSIGYEILGVRVMAQVLENTVYSFASALAVYLAGTALGAGHY
ncbi:MAG: hypothetical protein C4547_05715, partial [Phycisphaerales bacterium]